jgi:hypothetical protein
MVLKNKTPRKNSEVCHCSIYQLLKKMMMIQRVAPPASI